MEPYKPPFLLFNKHLETIYPSLIRKVDQIHYQRERITTPDNDFLDLDWLRNNSKKIVVLSHGLEGSSDRGYIKGMARAFFNAGFDVLAWNYRGCSGEINRTLRFYHSGATDDLNSVIEHVASFKYDEINLIGFSLGGNLTLKYLGEKSEQIHPLIKRAAVFSVPLNLHTSCLKISTSENWIYSQRFLKSLKEKVVSKARQFKKIETNKLDKINSLIDFDNHYTAPIHGFRDAVDYYEQCSSIRFIESIKRPALIVNAANDPFLSADCYPDYFNRHPFVRLEYPSRGGHVGFTQFNQNGLYWSEQRALHYIIHNQ